MSFEFQKRGAIHAHCLFWLEDQPDILKIIKKYNKSEDDEVLRKEVDAEILKALDFYSDMVNCQNPLIGDTDRKHYEFFEETENTLPQLHTCKGTYTPRN